MQQSEFLICVARADFHHIITPPTNLCYTRALVAVDLAKAHLPKQRNISDMHSLHLGRLATEATPETTRT